MNIKEKLKITLQYSVKTLSNIKLAIIKFVIFIKSIFIKLKSKVSKIKTSRLHTKSIPLKLRSAFLYLWNLLKIAKRRYINKKVIIPSIVIIILISISIPTIYFYNIINGSKDYKSVLAVHDGNKIIQKQVEAPSTANKNTVVIEPHKTPEATLPENGVDQIKMPNSNVITILFLGIDRTEERDKTIGVSRSDTIALVSINLDTKKVNILGIPRDTYAFVPIENKKDKINHAYAFGSLKGDGAKASIDAVEDFVKYAKIDYYFTTDMQPVPEIVDKLGGVELNVDFEIKDVLHKGEQLLDGQKALAYLRCRSTPRGDIDRIIHQQKFASAILSKLKGSDELINSISIILSYHKFVKTNMNLKQLAALARLWSDIPSGNSNYYIVPGYDKIMNKIWYYMPNLVETETMFKMIFQ